MREYQLKYIRDLILEYGVCKDSDPRRIDIIATIKNFLSKESRSASRIFSPPDSGSGRGVQIHHFFRHVITMVINNPDKTLRFICDFALTDMDLRRLIAAAAKRNMAAFNNILDALSWPRNYAQLTADLRDYNALAIKVALKEPVEFDHAWSPLAKVAFFAAHLASSESAVFTQAWVATCSDLLDLTLTADEKKALDDAFTQTLVVADPEIVSQLQTFVEDNYEVAEPIRIFFQRCKDNVRELMNSVSPRPSTAIADLKRAELTQLSVKIAANAVEKVEISRVFDKVANRHDMQYFDDAEFFATVSDLVNFLPPAENGAEAEHQRASFYRNLARIMPVQYILDGVIEASSLETTIGSDRRSSTSSSSYRA